jgi:steroid 5-alpha reductase family enzyme
MQIGLPDAREWPLLGRDNLRNAALLILVPVPAVVTVWLLFHWFPEGGIPAAPPWGQIEGRDEWAAFLLHHPLLTLNLLYFAFANVQLWLIALVQRSSWLIDPYWTLLPLFIAGFYLAHPLAAPNAARLLLAWTVLLIWSARLTWNYFRRERWRCGFREDWRYSKMRSERTGFWWEQFFVVHLAQHLMLVGLTLPFWAMSFRPVGLAPLDAVFFALALLGIGIAHAADLQLDRFMRMNELRQQRAEPKVWLLETGIWRYSRHPNYFGEQLYWWSIAGLGVVCGVPWVAVGTFFNSCVLAGVTFMTERRMLEVPERRAAYAGYQRRTSVWLPWPPGR